MSQAEPRQLQDSQMLQRQLMLKQFQELQKHRQFPPLADGRQQNYLGQQSENFMSTNTNFMPSGAYGAGQGFPNGTFSQPQTQDLFLTMPSHQPVNTFYRTPTASSTNNYNQNISPSLHFFTEGDFQSKQFTNGMNLFGQTHNENFQQINGSFEQFQGKTTKIDPSQAMTNLDPLEQKILFNMDGNGYTNTLECSDYLSSFPSIQSGSWSALMQSAVGESSSDSGVVQEEWSGLSFQNTDLSMDNKPLKIVDVGNQQNDWIDNNVASSLNGKSQAPFVDTNTRSGFPGFQLSNQQREGLSGNSQRGQPFQESQPNNTVQSPSRNAFPFQGFQLSDGNAEQRNFFAKSPDQTGFNLCSEPRVQQGNHNLPSATGSDYPRNQNPKLYPSAAAVKAQPPQVTSPTMANKVPPFDLFIPRGTSQSNVSLGGVGQQFPILESVPVEASKRPSGLWPNESGTKPRELSSNCIFSSDPINSNLQKVSERSSSQVPGAGLPNSQDYLYGEENGVGSGTSMDHLHQKNLDGEHGGDKQALYVSATDFEAFGRSLKPSNLHPNYSSSSEVNHEVGSVSVPSTSTLVNPYTYRDGNMQSIEPSSLPLMLTAEEMGTQSLHFSHTDCNVSDMAIHRTDHSQVNMQMASLYKQYEPLRNGHILSKFPSPLGKQMEISKMNSSMVPLDSQGGLRVSPPSTLDSDFRDTILSMTRPKKRKTATSDLLPWHTEVTLSSKRLQSINLAEKEWAKAVNRLMEKVDYGCPLLRPNKRLVLTTQLMQLVFMPAPATILRANGTQNYGCVAYFSAKQALGDACNLNSWSRNISSLSSTSDNMMTKVSETSEEMIKKHFSTIVEGFTSRAEKLEANFLRLDKTASVLDVIVEYKELEKFSLINRFAKFHVRGPQKAAEEISSSSGSTSSLLKPAPQRYVMAVRARALPEKIKCLAL